MKKTIKVSVKSTAHRVGKHIRVTTRTQVGNRIRTTTKTY